MYTHHAFLTHIHIQTFIMYIHLIYMYTYLCVYAPKICVQIFIIYIQLIHMYTYASCIFTSYTGTNVHCVYSAKTCTHTYCVYLCIVSDDCTDEAVIRMSKSCTHMCIYIHMYMYTYIYTYIYIYVHMCILSQTIVEIRGS